MTLISSLVVHLIDPFRGFLFPNYFLQNFKGNALIMTFPAHLEAFKKGSASVVACR